MSTDTTHKGRLGPREPMYAPKHTSGVELKGGGLRGGPKRWTGKGPRPARHIPWPEVRTKINGHISTHGTHPHV